jgi:type VI secretion system protein VasJ
VRDEVRFLLRRFPGLPELRFANDQPLAAPETRAWIRDRVLGAGGEEAAAPAQPAGAPAVERGGEGFEKARAEAWKLARERKLADAVALLGRGADQARRLRDRVWWRLEAARLLLDRGQAETALAQLEGLDTEIQRSTVEAWDPEVCAEVIKSLLVCRQKALSSSRPQSADEYQRTRELLGRLCRLDLVAALELQGRK